MILATALFLFFVFKSDTILIQPHPVFLLSHNTFHWCIPLRGPVKKYKKCKNTKWEETNKELTVSGFIFLLCHYVLKDTAIIQVMQVMKTSSSLSHRPQPLRHSSM